MKEYEKNPYERSRLKEWLAADTWSAQEAVCLLSDVDPTGAVISWGGFTNSFGGHVDSPKIEHGQLLSEGINLSFSEPRERVFEVTSWIDDEPFFDADKMMSRSSAESQQMHLRIDAESKVRRAWNLYRRNPEHSENDQRPPYEFVEWGKAQRLDIPWLDWAENNGYLVRELESTQPDAKESVATPARKTINTNTPERQEEKDKEVAELRDKAKKMAIKMKIDGIDLKYISAKKVCERLLKETFTSGKPFSSRWGTPEGMRSYLKREHNPTRTTEFRNAKSTRANFNS